MFDWIILLLQVTSPRFLCLKEHMVVIDAAQHYIINLLKTLFYISMTCFPAARLKVIKCEPCR